MDMTGEHRIPAPRQKVWEALNDTEVLKKCIPGCEELTKTSDTEFTARATNQVGPVKARFTGKVALTNIDPPNGYTISGEGQGGVAGFAKGGADVSLREEGTETVLSYVVKAQVGGKLAQIGSRLVDQAARKMANDFFKRFVAEVGDAHAAMSPAAGIAPPPPEPVASPVPEPPIVEPPGSAAQQPVAEPPRAAPQPSATASRKALPTWAWVGGLIVAVVVLLLLFGAF